MNPARSSRRAKKAPPEQAAENTENRNAETRFYDKEDMTYV